VTGIEKNLKAECQFISRRFMRMSESKHMRAAEPSSGTYLRGTAIICDGFSVKYHSKRMQRCRRQIPHRGAMVKTTCWPQTTDMIRRDA
jgi:hypothetical protein